MVGEKIGLYLKKYIGTWLVTQVKTFHAKLSG